MILKIKGLDQLPNYQQTRIINKINDIIVETFVNPADVDYITARFMALSQSHRGFFWPALQAIEKYLKANFLFNGVPVKKNSEYGHNILIMAQKLNEDYGVFKNLELKPMGEHVYFEEIDLWGSYDPIEYIEAIEKFGTASNRYNYFGADYEASYLPKLDQIIYVLRSKCVPNYPLFGTGKVEAFDYAAYEENFLFAPKNYNHGSMFGKFSLGSSIPSIEFALKGIYGNAEIFKDWLRENFFIKDDEIEKIKKR